MSTMGVLVLVGLAGLLVIGATVTLSTCRDVKEELVEAAVTEKWVDIKESQRTITAPPCTACPDPQPRTVVELTTTETHYVEVTHIEGRNTVAFRIEVSKAEYERLSVGDTVQLLLRRSTRVDRLCGRPTLVL